MSTGVQECDDPLITSSASCGFIPILPVHRCAILAPWSIAAMAHSFAAARPFATAFLAQALARCIALTRTSSKSSKSNCCGSNKICLHCSVVHPSSAEEFAIASSKPICTSRFKADLMSWNHRALTFSPTCSRWHSLIKSVIRAAISSQQIACLLWHCLVAKCLRAGTTVRRRNLTPADLPPYLIRSCSAKVMRLSNALLRILHEFLKTMPEYVCLCSCGWKPNRLRNHIWRASSCLASALQCRFPMLGLADKLDLSLSGLLRLGF